MGVLAAGETDSDLRWPWCPHCWCGHLWYRPLGTAVHLLDELIPGSVQRTQAAALAVGSGSRTII